MQSPTFEVGVWCDSGGLKLGHWVLPRASSRHGHVKEENVHKYEEDTEELLPLTPLQESDVTPEVRGRTPYRQTSMLRNTLYLERRGLRPWSPQKSTVKYGIDE